MIELAPIPFAGTGDPLTTCSLPSGVEQVGVTSMQAANMETLFDRPEFATKRLSPSGAVQLEFAAFPPAQREKASAAGFAPVGYCAINVSVLAVASYEKSPSVLVNWFAT